MWKKLFILLLLLSLVSGHLFSERILTEEQYQTLMTALENSDRELENQEKQILSLEKLQDLLNRQTAVQEQELERLSKSLEESRKQTLIKKIEVFIVGVFAGGLIMVIVNR